MMPRPTIGALTIALATALALAGCVQGTTSEGASGASIGGTSMHVTVSDEAGTMTAEDIMNLEDDAYLVDVRTAEEYAEGHIPGALNASYPKSTGGPCQTDENSASFRNAWEPLGIPADAHVVVYCRTGVRASAAASALVEDGYGQVDVYEGSWVDWTSDPMRPVEG